MACYRVWNVVDAFCWHFWLFFLPFFLEMGDGLHTVLDSASLHLIVLNNTTRT